MNEKKQKLPLFCLVQNVTEKMKWIKSKCFRIIEDAIITLPTNHIVFFFFLN